MAVWLLEDEVCLAEMVAGQNERIGGKVERRRRLAVFDLEGWPVWC